MRGRERHWWRGFALFSACYLALALAPWLGETAGPLLGTTLLLGKLHERMHPALVQGTGDLVALQLELKTKNSYLESFLNRFPKGDQRTLNVQAEISSLNQRITDFKSAATYDQFQRVGRCLFALISGLIGGSMALWFYARRKRQGAS
jgi:hypothetical protein